MASIFYRFGSEIGIWRELIIDVDLAGGLLVSDLKILIADEANLTYEFARRTDLSLSLYDINGNVTQLDDNCVVHQGDRIVVNRISWTKTPNIIHDASKDLPVIEPSESREQSPETELPESLNCTICQQIMKRPILVKCTMACGSSGCRKCVLEELDKSNRPENNKENSEANKKKCPFCEKGLVIAITINRRLQGLLESLENKVQTKLDEQQEENRQDGEDSTAATEDVKDKENEEEDLPTLSYPSCYVYLFSTELFNLICNKQFTFVSEGQSSWLGVYLEFEQEDNPPKIIPVSLVGGGTSYVIGGVFELLKGSKVNVDENEEAKNFLEESNKLGIDRDGMSVYSIKWLDKFADTPMVPIRKHPFSIIMSNNTFRRNNEILSTKKVLSDDCTEVAIDQPTFDLVVTAIKTYKFSDKPDKKSVKGNGIGKRKSRKITWRDLCYPGGPKPIPLGFGENNPYVGYCHLLPFLSEPQFQLIKKAQELLKIKFLKSFKKKVIKSIRDGDITKKDGIKLLGKLYDNLNEASPENVNI